jgi:hypothetical protein
MLQILQEKNWKQNLEFVNINISATVLNTKT